MASLHDKNRVLLTGTVTPLYKEGYDQEIKNLGLFVQGSPMYRFEKNPLAGQLKPLIFKDVRVCGYLRKRKYRQWITVKSYELKDAD